MATVVINPFVFAGEELGGMVLIEPTSIAYTGTSASIGANGSVEFTAVTSLSLNGVFSSTYDNYMISLRAVCSTSSTPGFRMRASGADATGANYTYQYLYGNGSSVTGARASTTEVYPASLNPSQPGGAQFHLYGPYLSQPTAGRSIGASSGVGGSIWDLAWTHSIASAYDGFSLIPGGGLTITGLISVYGLVGA